MTVLIFGGAGFIGLNIAEALLARGQSVTVFDLAPPPASALASFQPLPGRLARVVGDVTDAAAVRDAIRPGLDAIVLGAAVTADAERDRNDPELILRVNLMSHIPILERARAVGVRRLVNLSSAAAYGAAGSRAPFLAESAPAEPESLYGLSKFASEQVAGRLRTLWDLDIVSVRLSAAFGPWERKTGLRDTPSPQHQLVSLATAGRPALLERPGLRDWVYGPDVAEAVTALLAAGRLGHPLYNVSAPGAWTILDWGHVLARSFPGFVCRLAEAGEAPTVSLHAALDRPPLDTSRLRAETGWSARFGLADSAEHYAGWLQRTGQWPGAFA